MILELVLICVVVGLLGAGVVLWLGDRSLNETGD